MNYELRFNHRLGPRRLRRGSRVERTLYGFEFDDQLYVSSNHWFRSWYHLAAKHPDVDVTRGDEKGPYRAVVVTGEEHDVLTREYHMGVVLRLLCGFAPSKFLRLDPVGS